MGVLKDALAQVQPNQLGGTGTTFIDADTLRDAGGEKYRIQGINAGEVEKITPDGEYKQGTAGGKLSTEVVQRLANKQGFTNIVPQMDADGNPVRDPFGRVIADLQDEKGRSFNTSLAEAGAFDVNKYTTESDRIARDLAEGARRQEKMRGTWEPDDFEVAAMMIQGAEESEGQFQLGIKEQLSSEAERAAIISKFGAQAGDVFDLNNVKFRNYNVDLDNNSRNPLSDSWNQGLLGVKEGAFGMIELLGTEFDSEWAQELGEQGIAKARAQQTQFGEILTDWKDVKGLSSGLQYIGNNAAMSLPYMLGSVAGGVAAAAGGTAGAVVGGAAALGSASVYAGQAWNEQEGEKDAAWALGAGVTQAALERLGVGVITGKVGKTFADDAVKKIMKAKGLSKEAAEGMLAQATKTELGSFLNDAGKNAARQIAAKRVGKTLLASAASEGATEVMQEAIAYTAGKKGELENFDWSELNERLIASAIAGASLGGVFATPGSIKQAGGELASLADNQVASKDTATDSAIWAQQEVDSNGYVATNQENLAILRGQLKDAPKGLTLDERAQQYEARQGQRDLGKKAMDAMANIPALFKGATSNIFTPELMAKSRSARIAADLFGGNPNRVFSGASMEDAQHLRTAQYKNMVDRPDSFYHNMNGGKRFTDADKARISNEAYAQLQQATDKNGKFDPSKVTGKNAETIKQLGLKLNKLADKMHADQKKHNPELGYVQNYLHKYKALDKKAVANNRKGFENALQSEFNMSHTEARDLVDAIVDDPNVSDIDQAFSVVKGGPEPTAHKKRTLGLSEKKQFQEFMQQDIFANVSQAATAASRYSTHREFVGKNAENVNQLINNIQAELGNTPEAAAVADQIAKQMKDYLDAASGNYKRPTSQFGKKMQRLQKNAMMAMTFSGLPLATFSSLVETALITRGLKQHQIRGKEGSLEGQGKKLAKGFINFFETGEMPKYVQDIGDEFLGGKERKVDENLQDLGFYEWDVGAATVAGATETNQLQQKYYEAFFKVIGLQQWTDYTRSLRASFAGDFIFDNLKTIADQRRAGTPYTRDIQETEMKLRNVGINIDRMLPIMEKQGAGVQLTPEEEAFFAEQNREAMFAFVNEAIVLPQAANRPLIYQDPRFALFTQFQGFLSTFTAKVLPKMYREAFGGGTKSMQYKAWATMATMIMLGFASQGMKDYLKYGAEDEDDPFQGRKTGLNPYLETPEYIRRGLMATGLLGTGERVLNAAFPIYETRSENAGDWLFNNIVGESPALGYVERSGRAAGHILGGDIGKGAEQLAKTAPIIGPFSRLNRNIGEGADWLFNGEQ